MMIPIPVQSGGPNTVLLAQAKKSNLWSPQQPQCEAICKHSQVQTLAIALLVLIKLIGGPWTPRYWHWPVAPCLGMVSTFSHTQLFNDTSLTRNYVYGTCWGTALCVRWAHSSLIIPRLSTHISPWIVESLPNEARPISRVWKFCEWEGGNVSTFSLAEFPYTYWNGPTSHTELSFSTFHTHSMGMIPPSHTQNHPVKSFWVPYVMFVFGNCYST